jgi:hypothetical protein
MGASIFMDAVPDVLVVDPAARSQRQRVCAGNVGPAALFQFTFFGML